MKSKPKQPIRSTAGVSFSVLILIISMFGVLPLGLLGFEIARYCLTIQELRNVTDAAALAGGAALTNVSPGMNREQLHWLAMQTVVDTFKRNTVIDTSFDSKNLTANFNRKPGAAPKQPDHVVLNILLLDENGIPQKTGSRNVKTLRVEAIFAGHTVFASKLMPIQTLEVATVSAEAGLPKLDVFICFDCSGSMDDQTHILLVKRYWKFKQQQGMNRFDIIAEGKLADVVAAPLTGTALNAFWPQNLSFTSSSELGENYLWSETRLPQKNWVFTLRSGIPSNSTAPSWESWRPANSLLAEMGKYPGNLSLQDPMNDKGNGIDLRKYTNAFTDLIVPVANKDDYEFPNFVTCLEASRGNLEGARVLNLSKGVKGSVLNDMLVGVVPHPGYYEAYWSQVAERIEPMASARHAAQTFIETVDSCVNAHFAFQAFTDVAGEDPDSFYKDTNMKIDPLYEAGGNTRFPLPLISLDRRESNKEKILEAIAGEPGACGLDPRRLPLCPLGGTNVEATLKEAIHQLTDVSQIRPDAKQAIILFTDGIPNEPGGEGSARAAAFNQAHLAHIRGIPIYTIGLSQNAQIKPLEDRFLGDNKNGSGKGLAYESGNHAIYMSVTTQEQLAAAFQSVARSLTVLKK
jgi:hypothetical protein